ncbi:phage tail protein [Arsenophonus endosymbiont of Crataerina pallida]|uniref:phage tail-collar fiber domain-containing protein n=2 Tax=unclassified Arsenophonus TaxID=2627083 RepID=UPI0030CCCB6F
MKYFCLLTRQGEQRIAEATALGTKIAITQMAVGDGGGTLPTPDTHQTQLVNERRRAAINQLWVDTNNPNQLIAEQIIPENEGGWWIRKVGLFDKEDVLIAIGNCPETYKPQLAEGSGRTQTIRAVFIVSHTAAVTLKIDPSVVLATRQYVDSETNKKIDKQAIKQTTGDSPSDVISQQGVTKALDTKQPIGDYVTQLALNKGLNNKIDKTQIVGTTGNSTDKVLSQKACDDNYAKKSSEEALKVGRLNIESPTGDTIFNLGGTNGSSGAEFAYVRNSKRTQVHDTNTKTTVLFPQKSGELALTSDVDAINNYPVGAPIPWPQANPPEGYLICDGQTFTKADYPQLALAYPSGKLPNLYGEFIRGLDLGGKVDPGRKILTNQGDALQNFTGKITGIQFVGSSSSGGIFKIGKKVDGSGITGGSSGVFAVDCSASFQSGLRTASETRPRNIAFLYIVRAA